MLPSDTNQTMGGSDSKITGQQVLVTSLLLTALLSPQACSARPLPLDTIKLPPGFEINIYADNIPGARSLTLSPGGTLFVGTRDEGKVYALLDRNGDNRADEVITLARRLNSPNGVAFRDGALYVAEVDRVLRYDDIEAHLNNPTSPTLVSDRFPRDQHHGWKFIRFGPDGMLYVPVGAPCNVCEMGPRHSIIMRMNPDGSGLETFARGVRNTVGFDWHPETGDLWFTDNGRDWLGDDLPPDELNHAPRSGLHFGFPYCHGKDIPDPQYGRRRRCGDFVPPALTLGPHVAALGMRFYTGRMFPDQYRNQVFIAEHGSWNRSIPIGYRVTLRSNCEQPTGSLRGFRPGLAAGEPGLGTPSGFARHAGRCPSGLR